ncbi:MAG: lipoate--protein ligase family protein [Candidatus Bathyarchaeota archaeon]|nr:MAG: lipoate--protein ligase family protein [Candidatus Bathyarchaeota archaeon]
MALLDICVPTGLDNSQSDSWRLLDLEYADARMNLAVEEAVVRYTLGGAGTNTLRLWRNRNTVVLGRFQCARLEVDLEACNRLRVDVIRRFTGGGTVYQDMGNLNYSLTVKKCYLNGIVSQSDFYTLLSQGVIEALSSLGISAVPNSGRGIWTEGKKVSGMAGFTDRVSYFGHGTLLLNSNLQIISKVLKQNDSRHLKKPVRSIPSEVVNLNALTGLHISMNTLKDALVIGFENVFEAKLGRKGLCTEETNLAEELYKEKYLQNVCSRKCPVRNCLPRMICPYAE